MKTGQNAGKILPSVIGELDMTINSKELNEMILRGVSSYLSNLQPDHGLLMPPTIIKANTLIDIGKVSRLTTKNTQSKMIIVTSLFSKIFR